MKCVGNFKFKGLTKRSGGEFKNENGDIIKYSESYSLKVDELTDNGVFERTFKIALDNPILKGFEGLELYDDITIEFNLVIFGTKISVIPVSVQ